MKNETQVQHTPGPWETGAGPSDRDLYVCEPEGGDLIAEVVNGSVADRNLIAAAPDLLAALQLLVAAHESAVAKLSDYARTNAAARGNGSGALYEQARAAIAKAEGGAL